MVRALSLALFAAAAVKVRGDATTYDVNAVCTCDQMMRYYGTEHDGLWGGSWWESAILMASLADISSLDSSYNGTYFNTFAKTYADAPAFNGYTGFKDDFYDDEGWWANAWVRVYDLTKNPDYLALAESLFEDISGGNSSCGGIHWEKGATYIASIANELYIHLAASLANRVTSDARQTYLDAATTTWDWFFASGVVGDDWLVVDGVDEASCGATGSKYSYNQGVILSGAVELYEATGNATYLELAGNIANATTTKGTKFTSDDGIITDCDGDSCDEQGEMFKGPLFRGMRALQEIYPHDQWQDWITTNAQALWNNALNVTKTDGISECNTGSDFSGPVTSANEVTQGAALEVLLAAWGVTTERVVLITGRSESSDKRKQTFAA